MSCLAKPQAAAVRSTDIQTTTKHKKSGMETSRWASSALCETRSHQHFWNDSAMLKTKMSLWRKLATTTSMLYQKYIPLRGSLRSSRSGGASSEIWRQDWHSTSL